MCGFIVSAAIVSMFSSGYEALARADAEWIEFGAETAAVRMAKHQGVQRFKGTFVDSMLQHPSLAVETHTQRYFLPAEADGRTPWIAIVPSQWADKIRLNQMAVVTGRVEEIDLGGPEGTKGSYRNRMIWVMEISPQ